MTRPASSPKPPVSPLWWPLWLFLLLLGLIVFYGVFTPGWMLVRLVAWAEERLPRRPKPVTGI